MISIIVPTLGRAGRLPAVLSNIEENTSTDHEVLFVVELRDAASLQAVTGIGARWAVNERAANYAGAINSGYERARGQYIFTGADDLDFHPGWDTAALARMQDPVRVVGTNDLFSNGAADGSEATHYLIDRCYIDETGGVPGEPPGTVLFEGYDHNFTDTEFICVARSRGVFAPGPDSVVEHLHPLAGKAEWDATYDKTRAWFRRDNVLWMARSHLWTR